MLGTSPPRDACLMPRPTAIAYSPPARWAEAALRTVAAAGALWLAARLASDALAGSELAPPPALVRGVAAFVLLPWALATLLRAWPRRRIALDDALAAVTAWRIPLPGPGFDVRRPSGEALGMLCPAGPPPGASEADPRARLAAAWRPP